MRQATLHCIVLACMWLCSLPLAAQTDSVEFDLRKKPKFSFRFGSNGSFITNQPANIFCIGFGLKFGKSVRFGIGGSWLRTPIFRNKILDFADTPGPDTTTVRLGYGNLLFFTDIMFYQKKKWELTVSADYNLGASNYSFNRNGTTSTIAQGGVASFNPFITAEYKVLPWVGLSAGLGLRIMVLNNSLMPTEQFNSLLYNYGVSVYLGQIYKDIVKGINKCKEKKATKNP